MFMYSTIKHFMSTNVYHPTPPQPLSSKPPAHRFAQEDAAGDGVGDAVEDADGAEDGAAVARRVLTHACSATPKPW